MIDESQLKNRAIIPPKTRTAQPAKEKEEEIAPADDDHCPPGIARLERLLKVRLWKRKKLTETTPDEK